MSTYRLIDLEGKEWVAEAASLDDAYEYFFIEGAVMGRGVKNAITMENE